MCAHREQRKEILRENLARVAARIHAAAIACGRQPEEITLLPVTKFHPAADLMLLQELGINAVGENREQEARDKATQVPAMAIHMIGQLQSKKTNAVARWAAAVHSVESLRLVEGLDRGMDLALERGDRDYLPEKVRHKLGCYIQVSADGDPRRGGLTVAELPSVVEAMLAAKHLELLGLMTVPPLDALPATVFESVFAEVDKLSAQLGRPLGFSAGMTGDLEIAIAAGSTLVRVGTDIMVKRPLA
ncbi:YggS family pyridoxal phosphate-dependent enzyme [Corynebacterium caspium]|uniref:YggS family pyridoxal phosphate-dependent enzyme n=1 Tax=Corynebacterium caspium TaxID=234828 RepID=UPI000375C4C1|nr:YggS family pyridoxal phosphate-dependent enzyme [Corynebacterium caspium]WKD59001.1 hypothetical protein CCASP_02985 [Corynebacterium caspium DSM 44850]